MYKNYFYKYISNISIHELKNLGKYVFFIVLRWTLRISNWYYLWALFNKFVLKRSYSPIGNALKCETSVLRLLHSSGYIGMHLAVNATL